MDQSSNLFFIFLLSILLWIKSESTLCDCQAYAYYDPPNNTVLNCITCPSTDPNNSNYSCILVKNGTYQTPSNPIYQCKNCIINCQNCSNGNICNQCMSGYFYNVITQKCQECSLNCTKCNDALHCTICVLGTYLSGNDCHVCSLGCTNCTAANTCFQCKQNWQTGTQSYYLYNFNGSKICGQCSPDCWYCSDNNTCLQCQEGLSLTGSNQCDRTVLCPDHCWLCFNSTYCTHCNSGYFIDNLKQIFTGHLCNPCTGWGLGCSSCNDSGCQICNNTQKYYLDFSKQKIPNLNCIFKQPTDFYQCLTVANGPRCNSCKPRFALKNFINGYNDYRGIGCVSCQFPCKECSTETQCTSCISTNYFLNQTENKCYLCRYHVNLTNCLTCSENGSLCYTCNTTLKLYYLDPNSSFCESCKDPCETCSSQLDCLSCVNHTYLIDKNQSRCIPCDFYMPNCSICLSENICLSCLSVNGIVYYANYELNSCTLCGDFDQNCLTCDLNQPKPQCTLCISKYFISPQKICKKCPFQCQQCSSETICSNCVQPKYYLDHDRCLLCSSSVLTIDCIECKQLDITNPTSVICLKCINNKTPINNFCSSCIAGKYADFITQQCEPCQPACPTCETYLRCLSCSKYYTYIESSKKCIDICGDLYILQDQCDNGIGIMNDGCDNNCKVQDGYKCNIIYENDDHNDVIGRSICSYTKTLKIELFQTKKQFLKNQMTLTYSIKPYLYGFPGTTNAQFTQDQLKSIFLLRISSNSRLLQPNSGQILTINSISYNPSQGHVSFSISYFKSIKSSNLQMTVNTQYLNSKFSGTPEENNFHSSINSEFQAIPSNYHQGNTLAGNFYTDDQYKMVQLISYSSFAIALLSILAFFLGLFTKNLAGLEMVMLVQFTYLSLFYYEGTMQISFLALKQLIYSTGYDLPMATDLELQQLYQGKGDMSPPPQAFSLGFNTSMFYQNINIMAGLYFLPLFAVLFFVPLRFKLIRRLSAIQLGYKWVDILMGEFFVSMTLFNYQYFLFSIIIYVQDGRHIQNYISVTIIILCVILTIYCFCVLACMPDLAGNYRAVFDYNTQLQISIISSKWKNQDQLKLKFGHTQSLRSALYSKFQRLFERMSIFINQSYFYKNYQRLHILLTYNHYNIAIVYYTLQVVFLTCLSSQISCICMVIFAIIFFVQLLLIRPYGEIGEKLRALFFVLIMICVQSVRWMKNTHQGDTIEGQIEFSPLGIIFLLLLALVWTYITIIQYFSRYFRRIFSDQSKIVKQIIPRKRE